MKLTIKEMDLAIATLEKEGEEYLMIHRLKLEKHNANHVYQIEELRNDEEIAFVKLEKNIKKLFKGVKSRVSIDKTELRVDLLDETVLMYKYNEYSFNEIDKALAEKAVELYKNEIGDPVERNKSKGRERWEKLGLGDYPYSGN